ncbi:MAG: trypsin-like peptidase domain-containing protein, partial [Roseibacillus sp.]|nr:trypsin-like peptidase domain-containing protein [Roseibacillus sp.]
MSRAPTILLCLGAILCGSIAWAHKTGERSPAETGKPLARYTPAVRLVEQSLPSVASIQTVQGQEAPGVFTMGIGSASVIHGDGYLLTNEHVLKRMHQGQALLPGRPQLPFRIIARMSSEDLALIKVEAGEPLRPIPIGRSDDLMLGEPVLIIGNPGGLTHSVSTGVVSGLRRSTAVGGIFLPRMVQTSAAVSGGNSGGPLINALGEQIGVVTSKKLDGENINFAITADRVREMFPALLSAELRSGFALGVEVDMYAPLGRVTEVRKDSPAARAGIGSGDVIVQLDGKDIGHGFDFHLALVDRKPGESLKIQFEREGEKVVAEVELGELELLEP